MFDAEEQQRFESFKFGSSNDMPSATTKRNSHHRRRSSVSTRHESAEMMGVSLPEQPADELSDKDNIRRRALWALEGKPEKVEIPELTTDEIEKKLMFDFPTRPSFPPGSGFTSMTKRDSFISAMDQLGTLHEEEEEDEYESPKLVTPVQPAPTVRARPAHLNLRPLSLTPESLNTGLPTPSLTPGRQGLKSLSLLNDNDSPAPRRPVLNLQISAESPCPSPASSDDGKKLARRSSISYKISNAGLPTPEMTPTFSEKRYSGTTSSSRSSLSSDYEQPDSVHSRESRSSAKALSASEQHFLFKSHNALLARITDLERALSGRRRESLFDAGSRPVSMTASDVSSEPSDEMLRLVADLKAERDELKRDVDGWRTRVGDLEKQIGVFVKRVENERREAWVARSKLGLVEVEKNGLIKELEDSRRRVDQLVKAVESLERENGEVNAEKAALAQVNGDLEVEVERLRDECDRLTQESEALTTPVAPQHGFESRRRGFFASVDSFGSATDVEYDASPQWGFSLKAVEEESEHEDQMSEEDNGLAGYEDEQDSDLELQSRGSSSSFGSVSEFPRSVNSMPDVTRPTHRPRASLSKQWTFPRGTQVSNASLSQSESVDKFFGCFDDSSSESNSPVTEFVHEYEQAKGLWSNAFKNASADDDFNPFTLPNHVIDTLVSDDTPTTPSSSSSGLLAVVIEEDEEEEDSETTDVGEDDVFGEIGGIMITFTPPQAEDEKCLQDGLTGHLSEVESLSSEDKASEQPVISVTTPPRRSAIPRPAALVKQSSPKLSSPITPPSKRPSFIPQPVTPPSPVRIPAAKTIPPKATFMRQPQRKPLNNNNTLSNSASGSHHLNDLTCKTQPLTTHLPQALPSPRRPTLRK